MNEFVTFEQFTDQNSAMAMAEVLKENGIEYVLEDDSASFDPTFAFGSQQKNYRLKLQQQDFDKADAILENIVLGDLDEIGHDYYLYSFSQAELMDVVVKKDEWSTFDFVLAQKILRERGHEISKDELSDLRQQRLVALAEPEKNQVAAVVAGYIFAILGGLFGIFIGWYLSTHKKTLPNGERVFAYNDANRKSGKIIKFLGIFFVIFWIAARIYWLAR